MNKAPEFSISTAKYQQTLWSHVRYTLFSTGSAVVEIIQSGLMLYSEMVSVIVPLEALNTVQCFAMTSCASLQPLPLYAAFVFFSFSTFLTFRWHFKRSFRLSRPLNICFWKGCWVFALFVKLALELLVCSVFWNFYLATTLKNKQHCNLLKLSLRESIAANEQHSGQQWLNDRLSGFKISDQILSWCSELSMTFKNKSN